MVFKFNGVNWLQEDLQEQRIVALGDNFDLKFDASNKNLIQLVDKIKKFIHHLHLFDSSSLVNNFPFYIAYQSSELKTNVIFFDKGKEIFKQTSFDGEKLLASSNYRQIMTIKNSTLPGLDPFEVIMRSTASFMPKISFPVVIEESRASKGEVRLKKFERDFSTTTQILITIPSNLKINHGWTEQKITKEAQETNYFDSDGKIVKKEFKKNKNEPEENFRQIYADNLLYDISGTLQISSFIPYKISDDGVDFYGFESYEKKENWKFDTKNLISYEIPLTGRTFIRLNSVNSTVTRTFTPKNQKDTFQASAWIRAPKRNGEIVQFLKAVMCVNDEKLFEIYGNLKNKIGEWSRVAVEIDLVEIVKNFLYERRALNATTVSDFQNPIFSIKLIASGGANSSVDVDSIAFHPIEHRLEANVYNEAGNVVSIHNDDNSISKFFYNPFNEKNFAKIKNDKIEIFKIAGDNVMIKITPQNGFHVNFDEMSEWTVFNQENFVLSNDKLHHLDYHNMSSIKSNNDFINEESAAVRFEYAIELNSSINLNLNEFKITLINKNLLFNQELIAEIPSNAEILILKHKKLLVIWVDGVSLLEKHTRVENSFASFEILCIGKRNFFKLLTYCY